jgi:hypothetical protein
MWLAVLVPGHDGSRAGNPGCGHCVVHGRCGQPVVAVAVCRRGCLAELLAPAQDAVAGGGEVAGLR